MSTRQIREGILPACRELVEGPNSVHISLFFQYGSLCLLGTRECLVSGSWDKRF
ncbi:hypothetical protein DMR_32780 [Solidesulfovibrio magneticus RS-1]|uniref:Uncharacterized protein n=1 Tax=Solidesulfovibrio magneticus (strain ATCC 700980 / DSM 13731 / RS-1) TaxID=573370 RepID=C4XJM2_SOLM1|nr:hypothetical protein DMR_32780 [Solidesulfovibrio magneticus RS-1]